MPPVVIAAGIAVAGTVASSVISSKASNRAAKAQMSATDKAADATAAQYQQTRTDLAPWRETGEEAQAKYAGYMGLGTSSKGQDPITTNRDAVMAKYGEQGRMKALFRFSGRGSSLSGMAGEQNQEFRQELAAADKLDAQLTKDQQQGRQETLGGNMAQLQKDLEKYPSYQFALQQGNEAIAKSNAGKGIYTSGQTLKDIGAYTQGLASSNVENYLTRLQGLSRVGQNAAAGTAVAGAQATAQQNAFGLAGANAYANNQVNQANVLGGAISGLSNIAGNYIGGLNTQATSNKAAQTANFQNSLDNRGMGL